MLMYRCLGTWWITAHQYPTLPIVNGYVLLVVMIHEVSVPRHRLSAHGRRAFAVAGNAGPTVWNSFPEDMRESRGF